MTNQKLIPISFCNSWNDTFSKVIYNNINTSLILINQKNFKTNEKKDSLSNAAYVLYLLDYI